MKKKHLIVLIMFVFIIYILNMVYAADNQTLLEQVIEIGNIVDSGNVSNGWGQTVSEAIKNMIIPAVESIGYLIFAVVTVFLGIKYMWSGYEGKSKVKDTLPTFVAALIFFYFADNLVTVIIGDEIFGFTTWDELSKNIYATAALIAQYISFGILLFVGLKYMFESSEGKAKLKESIIPLVIGIMFVFVSSTVVQFILNATSEVLQ